MDNGFSYRARSTNVGRQRLWAATALVVVLFAVDLLSGGAVRGFVREGVSSLSLAFERLGADISASGFFNSRASLESENEALKAQVASLQEQAALSGALQAQVGALESVVHLAQSAPGITAPVASSFIASPYGTFLIAAGSDEGVVSGALALSGEGVVVGRISDVSAHAATVLEIFAAEHSVDALLDGAPVTVTGEGGGNGKAEVPNGVTVSPGNAVTAPEFEGRVIGIVGHVDANPSNAAIQVSIGSPVDLGELQYVYVVPAPQS